MPDRNILVAELFCDARALLGEGPVWDHQKNCLYWVDIEGRRLHRYNTGNAVNDTWDFNEMPGAVFPTSDGTLLLAMESGFTHFDPETENLTPLDLLKNSNKNLRFNDGKCDPYGNLWIGTMNKELTPHGGNLYRINKKLEVSVILRGTTVSNGMAWSPDHRLFYYSDTATYELWSFRYDPATAGISDKKVCFRIPESYGGADGLTIDQEGMLWIAHWGGHCVRRWDPGKGKVLQTITVPAPHVTSCCFGGESHHTLYITTARSGLEPESLEQFPGSGGLFRCTLPVAGYPTNYVNPNLFFNVSQFKR